MAMMTAAGLATRLARLEKADPKAGRRPADLRTLRADPAATLSLAGFRPDPWQATALRCCLGPDARQLWLCGRQAGKSLTAAAAGLCRALCRPGSLVLLLSPTLRQSGELFRDKLLRLYRNLRAPVAARRHTQTELELANGSRVVSLPESESGVRCFSGVALLILDEASRVSDDLYRAVRPMVATSRGAILALTTPAGRRGWFFEEWEGAARWRRVRVTAADCPRIPPAFLAEERQALGQRWYAQEYECSFEDLVGAVFAHADVRAALSDDVAPLLGGRA